MLQVTGLRDDPALARLSKKDKIAMLEQDKEQNKRMQEEERIRAEEEAIKKGDDVAATIKMPHYE